MTNSTAQTFAKGSTDFLCQVLQKGPGIGYILNSQEGILTVKLANTDKKYLVCAEDVVSAGRSVSLDAGQYVEMRLPEQGVNKIAMVPLKGVLQNPVGLTR